MVYYIIYAKDFSGSTQGQHHYHTNGFKSFCQFQKDIAEIKKELDDAGDTTELKIIYLHWGNRCYEVNEQTLLRTYYQQVSGRMGTEPETIIKWIQQTCNDGANKIKMLYIITDGLIQDRSRANCFRLNENMHYERVVFHAFNLNIDSIDISVASSFFKSRCLIYRNYELLDDVNISEEFDYDKINVNNFGDEINNLTSYIKLKYISKSRHDVLTLEVINKLKKLRDRLFAELPAQKKVNLDTKDRSVFLREFRNTDWYTNLNAKEQITKVEIEKTISTLINYIVNDKKSYAFDALKFDKTFRHPIEEQPIVDVNFTAEQEIEFPDIILDDETGIPVIILTKCSLLDRLIFHKTKDSDAVSPASFNKFRATMECPLFLLDDQDISESIGYFYTLTVYKQLLEQTPRTEPRTRRPFRGGLVLCTDTDEFDKYNDYILAATYFDSKNIHYNIALFYYVLWKNAESKEWMDKNVVEQLKKYVMRRIETTVCKIGLSALPLDPPFNTSLLTALWYCVDLSSCIFKDDPRHFMQERLRQHYGLASRMIEILKYFNYDLDLEAIEKRTDLIVHVNILKKISQPKAKAYYILERIFKNVDGFLVSEIANTCNLHKLNYIKLNHRGMLCDKVVEETVHLNDYVHLMYYDVNKSKNGEGALYDICEKTYRPFFTFDDNKTFYTELMKITKKVVINNDDDKDNMRISLDSIDSLEFDKVLSFYNLFINYVKDTGKYPTLPEYVEYILKKKKYVGGMVTIFPSNFYVIAEDVYSRYQNIVTKVDVDTFTSVCKKYVKRVDRIKAEGILNFANDKEIVEFISSQESKINLIKRANDPSGRRKSGFYQSLVRGGNRRCQRGRGRGKATPRVPGCGKGRGRGCGSGRGIASGRGMGRGRGLRSGRGSGRLLDRKDDRERNLDRERVPDLVLYRERDLVSERNARARPARCKRSSDSASDDDVVPTHRVRSDSDDGSS